MTERAEGYWWVRRLDVEDSDWTTAWVESTDMYTGPPSQERLFVGDICWAEWGWGPYIGKEPAADRVVCREHPRAQVGPHPEPDKPEPGHYASANGRTVGPYATDDEAAAELHAELVRAGIVDPEQLDAFEYWYSEP